MRWPRLLHRPPSNRSDRFSKVWLPTQNGSLLGLVGLGVFTVCGSPRGENFCLKFEERLLASVSPQFDSMGLKERKEKRDMWKKEGKEGGNNNRGGQKDNRMLQERQKKRNNQR